MYVAPLLKQRVPRDTNIGELRYFFASQSRGTATRTLRQAYVGRLQAGAAGTQKIGKSLASFFLLHGEGSLSCHS
jgi:hypothetical protein